ncbi:MAG: pentapeptide repeat-containing protein [Crocosphaera sp.]|nr:pentapeptide repeat-containing protein [Crocosphaera sp.]
MASHKIKLLGLVKTRWWFVISAIIIMLGLSPILSPNGLGIREHESVTKTLEKDQQGNIIKTIETTEIAPGKTVWNWVSLLGVPITLAILGYWLEKRQQERTENERREKILQVYFDRISVLLLDKNLLAIQERGTAVTLEDEKLLNSGADLIRARTLATLRKFEHDPLRKGSVMQFLIDVDAVNRLKLNLSGANLSKVNLIAANLSEVYLNRSDLREVNLSEANLSRAYLQEAKLSQANLSRAYLSGANLREANLSGANLSEANLSGTNLREADLIGANLREADLIGAYLIGTYLIGAYLVGAYLIEANLSKAFLRSANLKEANLSKANLTEADLSEANLKETDLNEAYLFKTVLLNNKQIKLAKNWDKAIYTESVWDEKVGQWIPKDRNANRQKIEEIRNN